MKLERAMGIMGIILWVAIIHLRYGILLNNLLGRSLINVLPNFAVVWILYYFIVGVYYHLCKKRLPNGFVRTCIVTAILILLVFWEDAMWFHLEGFDIWDIVASCIAAIMALVFTATRNAKRKLDL